jgi:hypothetical protein
MKLFLNSFGLFSLIVCTSLHGADSKFIYGEAGIYGKEYLFVRQNISQEYYAKTSSETRSETTEPDEHDITKDATEEIVFPNFPFRSSPLPSFTCCSAYAVTFSQHRFDKHTHPVLKTLKAFKTLKIIKPISYFPEQRQKLSPAAIQFGMLTSFSPNSPTL